MFVLVTSVCIAFSGADIKFDVDQCSCTHSQYSKDSGKQYLAVIGS